MHWDCGLATGFMGEGHSAWCGHWTLLVEGAQGGLGSFTYSFAGALCPGAAAALDGIKLLMSRSGIKLLMSRSMVRVLPKLGCARRGGLVLGPG